MNNNVEHPQHYTDNEFKFHPVECIDITRRMSFCLGNAFKYVWRAGKKDPEKFKEDLEKAIWYLEDFIRMGYNEDTETAYHIFKLIEPVEDSVRYSVLKIIVQGDIMAFGVAIDELENAIKKGSFEK